VKTDNFEALINEKGTVDLEDILLHALSDDDIEQREAQQECSVADMGMLTAGEPVEEKCIRSISEPAPVAAGKKKAETSGKNLHARHRAKVRKRFLEEGLSGFQKHQVLELLLFYAIPRVDTNEIAHRLLNYYHGNLSEVLGADVKSLMKVNGVGESAAILLSMMPQVFRVYREELMHRAGIHGRNDVEQYIANRFTGEPVEKVLIACLDNKWNLLGDEFTSVGSVNFSSVNMRGIIEVCLRYDTTAAIIAHNHPRGTALPSKDDLVTTIEVRKALSSIGVRLVDHLIVAGEDYISLACSKQYYEILG